MGGREPCIPLYSILFDYLYKSTSSRAILRTTMELLATSQVLLSCTQPVDNVISPHLLLSFTPDQHASHQERCSNWRLRHAWCCRFEEASFLKQTNSMSLSSDVLVLPPSSPIMSRLLTSTTRPQNRSRQPLKAKMRLSHLSLPSRQMPKRPLLMPLSKPKSLILFPPNSAPTSPIPRPAPFPSLFLKSSFKST